MGGFRCYSQPKQNKASLIYDNLFLSEYLPAGIRVRLESFPLSKYLKDMHKLKISNRYLMATMYLLCHPK